MRIEVTTYSLELDDRFQGLRTEFEGGSAWVPPLRRDAQPPIFNFALSEVQDITREFEPEPGFDDDYEARVRAYFQIKRPGVRSYEDSRREVGGRSALVRTLEYEKDLGDGPVEVFALFVNIPLDAEFVQEFSADCPLAERATYEPLFWAAIESYTFKGGARAALDAQEAARAEQYARIDRLLARAGETEDKAAAEPPPLAPFEAPEDGADVARVGDFGVALVSKTWSVPSFSRFVLVDLTLRFEGPAADAQLVSTYADAGTAHLSISAAGVYGNGGAPRGRFTIEDGRGPTHDVQVRLKDFDIGLEFSGELEFVDGWVSLRGALGVSYDPSRRFELDVRARLDPTGLDWTEYKFTTLDELACADPAAVRHAQLIQLEAGDDLAPLTRCTALESLFLRHRQWGDPKPVALPAAVFGLERLTHLTVHSIEVRDLPDSIGRLTELERLALSRCALRATPAALWRLPKLRWLLLDANELEEIPAAIDLPALSSVDLSGNRLERLPDALFDQPNLTGLNLSRNPWVALPDAANEARFSIELEIEAKQRLLDFEYRGADGSGTVEWDEDAYYARSSPRLMEIVERVIAAGDEARQHADALRFLAKRGVALRLAGDEDYALLGNHRVGGMPDLPASIPYPHFGSDRSGEESGPTPYEFICQLDCEALAPLQSYLPRTGFLYFFLTTLHDLYGGDSERAARVLWFDGPREALVSGAGLHIAAERYFEMSADAYDARRATATEMVSPPEWYAANQNPHLFRGPAATLAEANDFVDDVAHDEFSEPLQALFPFDVAVGTYGFTQHEDPEHQASLVRKGRPEDWVVLLQVKSVCGMQWGDAGDLFFVAHKSDVAKRDFSRIFCTLESS